MRRLLPALALLAALAVRGVIPLERHVFDGHERAYLSAFLGDPVDGSLQVYPLLAGLYAALGQLTRDPRALLWLNMGAGALGALFAGIWVRRRWGDAAGLGAAVLVALSPTHAFWAATAYNVAIPQMLLLAACAAGRWGAPLYALACAMRVDLALLAPAVGLVAGWPCALGALGAFAVHAEAPPLRPLSLTLPANLPLTEYLGPLGTPLGLLVVLLATRRDSLPLLLAAAWTHAVAACFDDQGTRHELFGAACLGALVAAAPGWRRVGFAAAIALSLYGMFQLHSDYFATNERFLASVPALGPPPEGCVEVLDDPLEPRSHWNLRAQGWPGGPFCWGEEAIHRAWTSRDLQDRALRMRRLYDPEPVGVLRLAGGPRVVYRLNP